MSTMVQFGEAKRSAFLVTLGLLSLASAALVFWATRPWGAGLTADSISYISAARSLIDGRGFTLFDGTPMVAWPPLYPTLLALGGKVFSADPWTLAPTLNALLFGLVVYLSGWIARAHLQMSASFAWAVALTVFFSIPLFRAAVMALSEMLFIFLALCSFGLGYSYRVRSGRAALVAWAATIALATLTRYVGVVLTLWAVLLIATSSASRRRKWEHIFLLGAIAALPIALWWLRNWTLTGTLSGPRAPSRYTLGQNVASVFRVATVWYVPPVLAENIWLWLLLGAVFSVLIGVSWVEARSSLQRGARLWSPVGLFVLLYCAFLVVTASWVAYDPIDDRILAPLFVPLTWLFFASVEVLLQPYRRRVPARAMALFLIAALGVGLRYSAYTLELNVQAMRREGLGTGSHSWRENTVIHYAQEHRAALAACPLYSNDPYALYILANLPAKMSPLRGPYNSSLITQTLTDLQGTWPVEEQACLVWFSAVSWPHMFTLLELQTVARFEVVGRLPDGGVYRVWRAPLAR